jgi:hypothetical protein
MQPFSTFNEETCVLGAVPSVDFAFTVIAVFCSDLGSQVLFHLSMAGKPYLVSSHGLSSGVFYCAFYPRFILFIEYTSINPAIATATPPYWVTMALSPPQTFFDTSVSTLSFHPGTSLEMLPWQCPVPDVITTHKLKNSHDPQQHLNCFFFFEFASPIMSTYKIEVHSSKSKSFFGATECFTLDSPSPHVMCVSCQCRND